MPMKILALDASTEYLSLAVATGEKLYQYDQLVGQSASQLILPQIQSLLEMALAQASGARRVIAASDARMKEVYHAVYEKHEDVWREVYSAGVYKPANVPDVDGQDWVGVGTAWKVYADALGQRYQQKVISTLPEMTPKAEAIIDLAKPIFEAGQGVDASAARPIYIRNRVALTAKEREQGQRL